MNNTTLKNIIEKASNAYYNTEDYYQLTLEDKSCLESNGIDTQGLDYVDDCLFDFLCEEYKKQGGVVKIGAPVEESSVGGKVKLPVSMPSLNECKEGELEGWISNLKSNPVYEYDRAGCNLNDFVVSPKLDGVSFLVGYRSGFLASAFTRGDGKYGQLMTDLALKIKNIPNQLREDFSGYFRGELILKKDEKIKQEIEKEVGKEFKNLRNLVSGQVNAKSRSKTFLEKVDFVVYGVYPNKTPSSPISLQLQITEAWNLGLQTNNFERLDNIAPTWIASCDVDKTMQEYVRKIKETHPYECDGVVVSLNRFDDTANKPISETNHNPVGARKYKLTGEDDSKETMVEKVEWRVSKCGYLKPRVHLRPIELGGVTVTHATGFNYAYILNNGIGQGSIVKIKRAGDVIPHITSVVTSQTPDLPTVDYILDGVDAKIQLEDSEEARIKQFCYLLALFEVEQAGEANVRKLWTECDIHCVEEIIAHGELVVDVLGANGKKLFDSVINKFIHNEVYLPKFLAGVGVFGRGVGMRVIEGVINAFPDAFDDGFILTHSKLMTVTGISSITANKIIDNYLTAIEHIGIARQFAIKFFKRKTAGGVPGILPYKGVCFTGFRDKWLEQAFLKQGVNIFSGVTKSCDLLVCKDIHANTTKINTARNKGIEIIDVETAKKMVGLIK